MSSVSDPVRGCVPEPPGGTVRGSWIFGVETAAETASWRLRVRCRGKVWGGGGPGLSIRAPGCRGRLERDAAAGAARERRTAWTRAVRVSGRPRGGCGVSERVVEVVTAELRGWAVGTGAGEASRCN